MEDLRAARQKNMSLVRMLYSLREYRDAPLPEELLSCLAADFAITTTVTDPNGAVYRFDGGVGNHLIVPTPKLLSGLPVESNLGESRR